MDFKIPVERHVFEFLTSPEMYGSELPLRVRKDTLIGKLIIMLATKGPIGLEDYYGKRFVPDLPSDLVELPIDTTFPMKVEFIEEANLLYIGSVLDNLFEMQVIFYSMGYTARAGSERGAITTFHKRFGVEDNPIKQEALRGICKRYRERIRENQKKWDRSVSKKPSRFTKKVTQSGEKTAHVMKSRPTENNEIQ